MEEIAGRYIEGLPPAGAGDASAANGEPTDEGSVGSDSGAVESDGANIPGRSGEVPPFIRGASVEDAWPGVGEVAYVAYGILFRVLAPGAQNGEEIALIINVEAQDDPSPGYPLVTRAQYYCARLLASQQGTEFSYHYERFKRCTQSGCARVLLRIVAVRPVATRWPRRHTRRRLWAGQSLRTICSASSWSILLVKTRTKGMACSVC